MPVVKERFIRKVIVWVITAALSFSKHAGILSKPIAFFTFKPFNCLNTKLSIAGNRHNIWSVKLSPENLRVPMGSWTVSKSLVTAFVKKLLNSSAIVDWSVIVCPSTVLIDFGIADLPFLLGKTFLIAFQKALGLSRFPEFHSYYSDVFHSWFYLTLDFVVRDKHSSPPQLQTFLLFVGKSSVDS